MTAYKTIIDKLLSAIQEEKDSKHEIMTKIINYEYLSGQLYGVFDLAETSLDIKDFVELYDYRRTDRDELSLYFNQELINPVYNIVRNS